MLLRIRSNVGVWRVQVASPTPTTDDIMQAIAQDRPHVSYEKPLSTDPAGNHPLPRQTPLSGLSNGSMMYCRVDPASCAEQSPNDAASTNQVMRRVVDANGSIKLVPTTEAPAEKDRGFRKGMMALRDMKMQWTLADFVAMDSQFEFKIKRQEEAVCLQASLDIPSITQFQSYLQRFQFQRARYGFLYGHFVKDEESGKSRAVVEAIYEPPQEPNPDAPEGFDIVEDEEEESRVSQVAELLGLQKVGWIFGRSHKPDIVLTAAELILAAEFQLEAADGVNETPFVTIKVGPSKDGSVSVEAFQVSQQCMAMAAEEALQVGPKENECVINETFTAIQEGKPSPTVENSFFLCVVPIVQHTSDQFISEFPRPHRLGDSAPSHEALKQQLQKSGTAGWTFEDRLADFHLLLYLSRHLPDELPAICAAIHEKQPLSDGYKLILKSIAGMEGAY